VFIHYQDEWNLLPVLNTRIASGTAGTDTTLERHEVNVQEKDLVTQLGKDAQCRILMVLPLGSVESGDHSHSPFILSLGIIQHSRSSHSSCDAATSNASVEVTSSNASVEVASSNASVEASVEVTSSRSSVKVTSSRSSVKVSPSHNDASATDVLRFNGTKGAEQEDSAKGEKQCKSDFWHGCDVGMLWCLRV